MTLKFQQLHVGIAPQPPECAHGSYMSFLGRLDHESVTSVQLSSGNCALFVNASKGHHLSSRSGRLPPWTLGPDDCGRQLRGSDTRRSTAARLFLSAPRSRHEYG